MAFEIERKFLVNKAAWDAVKPNYSMSIRQGYLSLDPERVVRIRISGETAYITVKGEQKGITRPEFDYIIPYVDGLMMLEMCEGEIIKKVRRTVLIGNITWEVDEFLDEHQGLIIAEVELQSEDQEIVLPNWIEQEVSTDPEYSNVSLANA